MNGLKNFGITVAKQRKKLKMTQEELAARLNITPQAVSKWENGVGYPDITLLPRLAEQLGLPIEELFDAGVDAFRFPKSYEGLPLLHSTGNAACYSDKTLAAAEGSILGFTDGSSADLTANIVENAGPGEVRLLQSSEFERVDYDCRGGATEFDQNFGSFYNIYITTALAAKISLMRGGEAGHIVAVGSPLFIALLDINKEGKSLFVTVKSPQNECSENRANNLVIYAGESAGGELEIKINGSGSFLCEPDFDTAKLSINGSGNIKASNYRRTELKINGSGSVNIAGAGDINLKINGSGAVNLASAAKSELKINGSGSIKIEKPAGDFALKINGSGAVTLGEGSIGHLGVTISGGGSLGADKLTTDTAEISVRGKSDIKIGRIITRSRESLSRESKLRVLRRG